MKVLFMIMQTQSLLDCVPALTSCAESGENVLALFGQYEDCAENVVWEAIVVEVHRV